MPDGGQVITVWREVSSVEMDELLGPPDEVVLLSPEQVVSSRDAVGTFAVIPGGLSMATE